MTPPPPDAPASRRAPADAEGRAVAHALEEGVRLFESGAYWECHEALEPAWMAAEGRDRAFLSGLILIAAALHKARAMGSPRGGRRNLAKAFARLATVPDAWRGIDVRELEARGHAALRDPRLRPRVPYAPPPQEDA